LVIFIFKQSKTEGVQGFTISQYKTHHSQILKMSKPF